MKIVTADTMRSLDRRTIAAGTSDKQLMEQAATAFFNVLQDTLPDWQPPAPRRRFAILAGKGNNAGDGLVLARLLREAGERVKLLSVIDLADYRGAAAIHARRLPDDVSLLPCTPETIDALTPKTIIVDALLGTGIRGPLRPPFDALIAAINRTGLPVAAVDIPSGLNADTGDCTPEAVRADLTIAMALPKAGLLTANGLAHCGMLRCVDIGIPRAFVEEAENGGEAIFASDIQPFLGRRPAHGHKRTFGELTVIGGSLSYAGAPILAACAALRCGTGLVRAAVPQSILPLVPRPLAALIVSPLTETETHQGFLGESDPDTLRELTARADALVFGPGVGRPEPAIPLLKQLLGGNRPLVIDADGLRAAATLDRPALHAQAPHILTPHPGEMRVLLDAFGPVNAAGLPRLDQARALAERTGTIVVLKGLGTIIAAPDGRSCTNTSGSNALATAGTGDVLAGMIGGFRAQGLSAWDAARCGTFLHGRAAERYPHAARSLTADDLLAELPATLTHVSP